METEFDLIVIGAGINGAGIARDAAMRGLSVLLLDKGDIGGGTSSWSTRLIHGGLRYLEHGEFGLVRESLRERERLLKIAPHLVKALPVLVPIYENARRGKLTIRAGMIAYDWLSFDKTLPRHGMLSADETLERAPGLNREGLLGAAVYFDAQVEFAERLVLENVLSAIKHGAEVISYARVDKLVVEEGKLCGVEFIDASSNSRVQSRTRVVINAAGPWVDDLLHDSGAGDSRRLIGGTKGSHIIVPPFAGAPDMAIYVEAETDARPFFIIPWNGNFLIGTTDLRFDGDLDDVRIAPDEIDYLLRETNRVIPQARLTHESILYTYSGVRPLAFQTDRDAPSITRKHFIRAHPRIENLFSIVGGKLTTYRSLAEEAVGLVCKQLGQTPKPQSSDKELLPGAEATDFEAFSRNFKRQCGFPGQTADRWLRIYGTRSPLIVELINKDRSLGKVFDEETGAVAAEIVLAFEHELAQTLSDCLLRRTMVGLNSTCGLNSVEKAAAIAGKYLGWSDERVAEEIEAYLSEVSRRRVDQSTSGHRPEEF